MAFRIGIDTANNKKYSCMVSGYDTHINNTFSEIDSILYGLGHRGPLHWREIRSPIRKKAAKTVCKVFNNSKLYFFVFQHKKPKKANRKQYYLNHVPNRMTSYLDQYLRNAKTDTIILDVDDDFRIKGGAGTVDFVRKFVKLLSLKMVGADVKVRQHERGGRATLKLFTGKIVNLEGFVNTDKKNKARSVVLADLFLGFFLNNEKLLIEKVKEVREI